MLRRIALWGLVVCAPARAQQPTPAPQLGSFLERVIGLSATQLGSLERGELIMKVLPAPADRDVVIFGVMTVDVPRVWFVDHFMTADQLPRSVARTRAGTFGTPAAASDVGELTLSKDDIKDLKACRPGVCNFKLPAASMAFLSTRVDWSGDSAAIAKALVTYAREQMAAYVNDYRQRGNAAMVIYEDNASVKSSDAFAALLGESPYLYPKVPAFQRYLLHYPAESLDGVTNVIFWSQDQLPRSRPIFGIRHLSIFSPPAPGDATVIATKQLWADHYLEANLDMLSVVDRPGASGHEPGTASVYLVALRQFRFDNLPNNRLYSIRNRVADGLRDQTEADLRRLKQSYEESYSHVRQVR